jgi:hypothetical protein
MDVGLLWYDAEPGRALAERLGPAVHRYREKFGRVPNRCFVHPTAVAGSEASPLACTLADSTATIWVVPAPNVLLHHYWLGEVVNHAPAR